MRAKLASSRIGGVGSILTGIDNFRFYLQYIANASTIFLMSTSSQTKTERDKKRLWVLDNRGVLARIARELGVSHSAVGGVLHYNLPSKGHRIEKALADAGAPYMQDRLHERMAIDRRCA